MLHDVRQAVLAATNLSAERKLEIAADIHSLQGQLQKPVPDRSVIRTLWPAIEKAVTAGGFVDLMARTAELIGPLIR